MGGTMVLDCTNGARKYALTASLLGLLDQEGRNAFADRFCKAGIDGVTCSIGHRDAEGVEVVEFEVLCDGEPESSSSHAKAHEHRTLADVSYIIETLSIDGAVAENAIGIYKLLARAEAKAHGVGLDEMHFHEVGNNYAIGGIVAFCMLMEYISPDSVASTPVTTGFGFVECAHGRLEIPAPATSNIIADMGVPTEAGDVEGELCTPTGAAMVSYFAQGYKDAGLVENMVDTEIFGKPAIGYGEDVERFGPIRALLF